MITLIKIKNYKVFQDFEYRPRAFELLLGDNGSGKTSLFDVLSYLREHIVNGRSCNGLFPTTGRTAWSDDDIQEYEFRVRRSAELFSYKLQLGWDPLAESWGVLEEEVCNGNRLLFQAKNKQARVFRNDGGLLGQFPVTFDRSAIPGLGYLEETSDLNWLRDFVKHWFFVLPKPFPTRDEGRDQFAGPAKGLVELASWIREMVRNDSETTATVEGELVAALNGFKRIRLVHMGPNADLVLFDFQFGDSGSLFSLRLSELSEGQRQLIALHTIQHCLPRETTALFIDEPDNFLALREIQPWLLGLQDYVTVSDIQCFIISHHPELMNQLAANHGSWFSRRDDGSVVVQAFQWLGADELVPSEIIARGWIG